MAKPRIFISSTYYDLKYIRRSVEQFIESLGYEATVFESGDVPFSHEIPLDESCYREISLCHVLVMIIGGRYGSMSSEERLKNSALLVAPTDKIEATQDEKNKRFTFYNSVTSKEYLTAREVDIPIYIFVEKGVLAEYETYKKNRHLELNWAHVDSTNVFLLLDDIFSQSRNNLVKDFTTADDITSWLRDQWAGLLAHFIHKRREDVNVGQLKAQMDSLSSVVNALKSYSEQIVRNVAKDDSESIISKVDKELQERQRQSLIRSVSGLSHLIDTHGEDAQAVFQAFSDAVSVDDLFVRLDNASAVGRACTVARDLIVSSLSEVNNVRGALGLKPFEHYESKDKDLQDRNSLNLRRLHDQDLKARRLADRQSKSENDSHGPANK